MRSRSASSFALETSGIVNGRIAVAPAEFWIVPGMRISLVRLRWRRPRPGRRHRWIVQETGPKAAPHSSLAGTLAGLLIRCCRMIGVYSWWAGSPRIVIANGWTKSVSDPLTIGKWDGVCEAVAGESLRSMIHTVVPGALH